METDRLKVVLIGQAPSKESDPNQAFSGRSGRVLAKAAGVRNGFLFKAFECRNLFDYFPGKPHGKKGHVFPTAEARARAKEILPSLVGRRVIFVGKCVAEAFGLHANRTQWSTIFDGCSGRIDCAWIPHPSGINLWWNLESNRAAVGALLKEALILSGVEDAKPRGTDVSRTPPEEAAVGVRRRSDEGVRGHALEVDPGSRDDARTDLRGGL